MDFPSICCKVEVAWYYHRQSLAFLEFLFELRRKWELGQRRVWLVFGQAIRLKGKDEHIEQVNKTE